MRSLIIAALLLIAGVASAEDWEPTTPIGWVMSYECTSVDPQKSGFKCTFDKDGMHIQWVADRGAMSAQQKARAMHDFFSLGFRFFDFGGVRFDEKLPDGSVKLCERWKGKINFSCYDKK